MVIHSPLLISEGPHPAKEPKVEVEGSKSESVRDLDV